MSIKNKSFELLVQNGANNQFTISLRFKSGRCYRIASLDGNEFTVRSNLDAEDVVKNIVKRENDALREFNELKEATKKMEAFICDIECAIDCFDESEVPNAG